MAPSHDNLIGSIQVVCQSPWDTDLRCPFVIELFVGPDWRPRRVGATLLKLSAAVCAGDGQSSIALRTAGENASAHALRLYRTAGMRPVEAGPPGSRRTVPLEGAPREFKRYRFWQVSEQDAVVWDESAATFDQAADHGLADPEVRLAWLELLRRTLPSTPSRVADLGCGTGSLSILAAELGHRVDGVDFSEQMLVRARAKAVGLTGVTFTHGNAASPMLAERAYDAVLSRHVLWALPDPAAALAAWSGLLRSGGRLVLVEGRWSTGSGLASTEIVGLLNDLGCTSLVTPLDDPRYWAGPIDDERYLVTTEASHRRH